MGRYGGLFAVYIVAGGCGDNLQGQAPLDPPPASCAFDWATVTSTRAIVEDFAAPLDRWYYARIGTDRGTMGPAVSPPTFVQTADRLRVESPAASWGGVWTSLRHRAVDVDAADDTLELDRLLGPHVRDADQVRLTAIELAVADGTGALKLELKGVAQGEDCSDTFSLPGGATTIVWTLPSKCPDRVKVLNWLVDGAGFAEVDEVGLRVAAPAYPVMEAVFLYSYAHLDQCHDPASGLVRDRAEWPVQSAIPEQDFAAVPAIGTHALVTAVAWQLGHVEPAAAREVVQGAIDTLAGLPTCHGLLPHFVRAGDIVPDTEWSSIDTVLALIAAILAGEGLGLDVGVLEDRLRAVDWAGLADAGGQVGHGYGYRAEGDHCGTRLSSAWDTYGSEAQVLAVAHAAATGTVPALARVFDPADGLPKTWDESGFNSELAALLFPVTGVDHWGVDVDAYRAWSRARQLGHPALAPYRDRCWFGVSASEVPEAWTVGEAQVYGAWGLGGHNHTVNDGSDVVGAPIVAPHYAAMVASEEPAAAACMFTDLIERGLLSPLNNAESVGPGWSSLKGSWNLSLQALGAARARSCDGYLPYQALRRNAFLDGGFRAVFPAAR